MRTSASTSDLIGHELSNFYVEKHEYPRNSGTLSELPVWVWVFAPENEQAIKISVGSNGCGIYLTFGRPRTVDMKDYGNTVILPQFVDEDMRTKRVQKATIEQCDQGETLSISLSDGSKLVFVCLGDDELRPSIDQS